jgi:hypothetical protein
MKPRSNVNSWASCCVLLSYCLGGAKDVDFFIDLSFPVTLGLTCPLSPTISVAYKDLMSCYNICIGIIGRLACF